MSDELTEAAEFASREIRAWFANWNADAMHRMRNDFVAVADKLDAALRRERARPAPAQRHAPLKLNLDREWAIREAANEGETGFISAGSMDGLAPAAPEGLAKELHDAAMEMRDVQGRCACTDVAQMLLTHPKLQPAAPAQEAT